MHTSPDVLYKIVAKASNPSPQPITVATNSLKELYMDYKSAGNKIAGANNLAVQTKKKIRQQSRQNLKQLNIAWLNEMVTSPAQLTEKMSLFWHGHFACRVINIYFQQLMLNMVRSNALSHFGDLLKAVSKSAAMLSFLNNQQNRKAHPNENFAREVMELFTLGRGHYTEEDVKEAARAFTGWGFDVNGEFKFRPFFHDNGNKTFLGKTGNFDGDDILNIILEQKQTALFITQKIYRYFVNDTINSDHVAWLAGRFYGSNYSIEGLMNDIFTSNWFYEEQNIGAKIKSPVELLVGIRRTLPMQLENDGIQLLLQKALGQLLFYPPNVAGWPGGKSWIDSSSLMLRLRLPQLIKDDDTFFISTKQDDDLQMGMTEASSNLRANPKQMAKEGFSIRANVDWASFTKDFAEVPKDKLYNTLQAMILQVPAPSFNPDALQSVTDSTSREAFIQSTAIALMSTPEYQLC